MNTSNTQPIPAPKQKQPKVFYLASITSLFERFGYYLVVYLLVLFLKAVYALPDDQAFAILGVYCALGFLTPVIGGYITDNVFGIKRSLVLGLSLEAIGLTLLFIPIKNKFIFFLGLSCIIIGAGLFKTTPTNLLGRSYDGKDDPRIDSGFTLFYMAMNIGGVLASVLAGYLTTKFGWHVAYFSAAVGLYFGVISYFLFKGLIRQDIESKPGKVSLPFQKYVYVIGGSVLASFLVSYLLYNSSLSGILIYVVSIAFIIYIAYEIFKLKTVEEKFRVIACIVLILMATVFFMLYFQAFTSMELFVQRNVDRFFFGVNVSTPIFLGLDPIWVLILGPILAKLYEILSKRKKDLSITTKIPLGIFICGLCFLLLKISTFFGDKHGLISSWWIIFAFFLYALGELLTGALGVAMVTRIVPKRLYGVMMGAWFLLGSALGSNLSGQIAGIASIPEKFQHNTHVMLSMYGHAFYIYGLIAVIAAMVCFALSPFIKKMANLD